MRIILPVVIAAPPGCQPPSFRARGRDLHHPPPDASSRATHRRALRGPFLHGATFSLSEEEPASVEMSGGIQASLAGRYATALFALARDARTIDKVESSLAAIRSEEHTSELQSIMRNTYAVLCLKKQKDH